MKKTLLLSLVLFITSCTQHSSLAKEVSVYNYISQDYAISKKFEADFNGNNNKDHIYLVYSEDKQQLDEVWITDDGRLFLHHKNLPSMNHYFFSNLDNDPENEVIIFRGEEDGTQSIIYDISLESKIINPIFSFFPVIEDNGKYFWGYAWDIGSVKTNNNSEILSSLDSNLATDSPVVNNQKRTPILIFSKKENSQPDFEVTLKTTRFHSMKELLNYTK